MEWVGVVKGDCGCRCVWQRGQRLPVRLVPPLQFKKAYHLLQEENAQLKKELKQLKGQ